MPFFLTEFPSRSLIVVHHFQKCQLVFKIYTQHETSSKSAQVEYGDSSRQLTTLSDQTNTCPRTMFGAWSVTWSRKGGGWMNTGEVQVSETASKEETKFLKRCERTERRHSNSKLKVANSWTDLSNAPFVRMNTKTKRFRRISILF